MVEALRPLPLRTLRLRLFPNERQRLIHDAVREVHARLATPLDDRFGVSDTASSLCCENDT